MGLKKAENQVKILLAETILSMCRNTLNYHAEICVEGLLGITLDNEEIFLVNINQTIKNQIDTPGKAASSKENLKRSRKEDLGSDTEPESSSNESESSSTKKRRKRVRRKKHKGEKGSGSENGELADVSANADQTLQSDETDRKFSQVNLEQTDGSEQYYENSNQTAGDDSYTEEGAPSSVNVTVKQEPPGGPESDDDLVFVKQEVDEFSMSQPSAHQFSNLSQVFQSSADMSLSQPSDMMSGAFFASPANNMSANAMQQPVPGPSGANTGTLPRKNSTGRKVSSGSGSKGQGGKSASVKKGSSSAFDLTGITIVEDVDFREEISVKREIGESVDCGTVSIVKIEETGGPYTGYGLSPGLQALGRMIASGPPAAHSQASGRAAQSASLSHAAQSKQKGNQGVSLNVGQSVCQSVSQSPASAKGKSSAKKRVRKRVRPSMQGQNPEDSGSPCRCNLCGKEMSASALEAHMRIHTGERPFKCSLCGRDFVLKHKLKSHWIHAHKLPWKDEYA